MALAAAELGILVLRNLAEKTFKLVDHGVGTWLSHIEADAGARRLTTQRLRSLVVMALVALIAVPTLFSLVFGAAIALPVGAAFVCAGFLISAAAIIAVHKNDALPTEAELEQGASLVSAAMVPGAVLIIGENGQIEHCSGRDIELFPKQLRKAEGKIFAELLHVGDRLAMLQALDGLRQGMRDVVTDIRFENHGLEQGQQFLHARLDMTAEADAHGRRTGRIIAHLTDLSERHELLEEIARCAADVASANEAKSRFLAAVSHEMRTPLNAVLGFSDILAGEYFGKLENDRQREYVGLIRQSGAHLLSVVNSMLDMSKLDSGHYELMLAPFDVAEPVQACEAMLSLQARDKGLTLTSRISPSVNEIVADQRAVQQVLINLAGNAIKFTQAGGVVTIDASQTQTHLTLSVSDTGIGIASDMVDKLGTPFTQVQSEHNRCYEGTGLGLALVKGFVALHGGTLNISSRLGEGTVVTVTLPVDGSGAERLAAHAVAGEKVEFPPRLKPQQIDADYGTQEDERNGSAKANVA
jgi:cell cycle sensor histidine kinase DivJ